MDRVHFIEHAVERLDDEAFAAFLTWFDHYADTRWAGRHRDAGAPAMGNAIAHSVANAVSHLVYDSVTNSVPNSVPTSVPNSVVNAGVSVAMTPAMVCEPQLAAWSARAALEE